MRGRDTSTASWKVQILELFFMRKSFNIDTRQSRLGSVDIKNTRKNLKWNICMRKYKKYNIEYKTDSSKFSMS